MGPIHTSNMVMANDTKNGVIPFPIDTRGKRTKGHKQTVFHDIYLFIVLVYFWLHLMTFFSELFLFNLLRLPFNVGFNFFVNCFVHFIYFSCDYHDST